MASAGAAAALILAACDPPAAQPPADRETKKAALPTDCYEAAQIGIDPPEPERAVFVLVDQTTGLDDGLRDTVADNLKALLGPGTAFTIATFSARSKGRYATVTAEGELQAPPPKDQRPDLSVPRLQKLDGCLAAQAKGMKRRAAAEVAEATDVEASTFNNSEILASLTQLSERVKDSPARDKLVILVSDLLEYSPATSFYSNKELRKIDPAAEFEKIRQAGLVGDFAGARIAVVGAGLQSAEAKDSIRDTEALAALRSFWERWLRESNGTLAQYGEPNLVTRLAWNERGGETSAAAPDGG